MWFSTSAVPTSRCLVVLFWEKKLCRKWGILDFSNNKLFGINKRRTVYLVWGMIARDKAKSTTCKNFIKRRRRKRAFGATWCFQESWNLFRDSGTFLAFWKVPAPGAILSSFPGTIVDECAVLKVAYLSNTGPEAATCSVQPSFTQQASSSCQYYQY